jgi:arylsulfatase A-like enzyme
MRFVISLISLLTLSIATPVSTAAKSTPPNILFILVDDLGWTDLGCYGSSFYETPHVDALAASGMRFTNAYAAGPVCSPTRASIMTGKYPARMFTTDYFGAAQPDEWKRDTKMLPAAYTEWLPHEEITLAELLKEKNYATFFAGKWHLGPEDYWPKSQGFDINQGGFTKGVPYGGKKYFSPYGNPRLEDGPDGEHLPDRLASETVKFMSANKDKPFLAYLSFYSVHTPLISRQDLKEKYQKKSENINASDVWGQEGKRKVRLVQDHAVYGGMVEAMDLAVGKVLEGLDDLGLANNTLVIFTSDNGGLNTSEGHPTSNLPLRAGKGWLYEGGIREPLIIRWPSVTKAGTQSHQVVTSTDYFPTIAAAAGIQSPNYDGVDLSKVLQKKGALANRPIFWHYPHYGNQGGSPGSAIRKGHWKLIEFYEDNRVELYNLKDDIGEQNNLADSHPRRRDKLLSQLREWRDDMNARYPSHK